VSWGHRKVVLPALWQVWQVWQKESVMMHKTQ